MHECITLFLSVSLSSLQALSCFFQLSTLAEDSCSASTSLALFSLKVWSSVSHFLALVLLSDRSDRKRSSRRVINGSKILFQPLRFEKLVSANTEHISTNSFRHIYLISIAAHYAVERCLDHNKKKQKFKLEVNKIPPKSNKLAPACDLLSFISQRVYSYLIDKDGEICDVYLVCITVPTSLCMAGLKCFALSSNVDRLASQHSAVLCCFTAVTLSTKTKSNSSVNAWENVHRETILHPEARDI